MKQKHKNNKIISQPIKGTSKRFADFEKDEVVTVYLGDVIEDGEIHVFDVHSGQFIPASVASHSGHGPYVEHLSEPMFNEIDSAYNTHSTP